MNTAIQHSLNSTNPPKGVDSVSVQDSQIESIQWAIVGIKWNIGKAIEQIKAKRDIFLENQSKYFELAGYWLEKQNHGAPECRDIAINEEEASWTKPQAWLQVIDGMEHWFYNYPGALAEAKYLGKVVPTIDQWIEMLGSVPGNTEEKAWALNIPLVGYRNADDGEFCGSGLYADFWSSSSGGKQSARCVVLKRGHADAIRGGWDYDYGVSLRFLSGIK